uniref:Helix-turn-helix domain-containing protein n=1 Tax=Roseihalotalea indica TaxID=2867963 RepID=A0AA49GML6_9BACT|nr:helix-turn-helix domain-containing protein [Tunicatimonas sp. TK19036]
MKPILFITGFLSLALLLLSAMTLYDTGNRFELKGEHTALVVRKIGHTLLLHAGDSSSRVLPVRQRNETTFELAFQSPFAFMPDSLVHIVRTQLDRYNLSADYLVQVLECTSQQVVYGFAIGPEQADIVPCNGRVQPQGCYTIQIAFTDLNTGSSKGLNLLFTLGLASLAALGFVGYTWVKQSALLPDKAQLTVGHYSFYPDQCILESKNETISLSVKETQLLRIFAAEPNQLIERDRLLKEVWEDEGVITGRSLDVFVSRLRKKLQNDPSVQLTNIHGKGYVLEVNT